uniref:Uncharacterized protein n=1 Tax=Rhizophora mucronata TaxID=61149 RepID=A0A2P2PU21_RHIMU
MKENVDCSENNNEVAEEPSKLAYTAIVTRESQIINSSTSVWHLLVENEYFVKPMKSSTN